ncbi:MAG: hypothetical protein A2268_13010 [Candidatus Raymondbacteria bacterium RifOxyA12_full_50_37]|uniref:Response regulatory domain-containing protein n=1 Tax=Candidatus Raymondbacteria bacterium RIFOXYD12_FULL_49_13 TaxID=1817890 RepID=A0A1F7EZU2_UNCRA|nr:MAG: hypothetical protein A2268_13010 [Candidatus Raymondbacteria bacterium RifOxyA12_full_50_37]OGJ92984.1 MAG: hypothetical protein A2248_18145 [Candidatus Raymondbacteria bacterium RIFOXYA2_FULL_49_16]OGJ97664.1 MAG: hypothetical protein A2487_13135 [Candidatus Raymondbacteria bacterium RifOxyC12_full_50_8]OGJ99897.1 MAG: hypothetical protein A2519_00125 [Candidatus Raymondbacteria bacterium RIFOXYD12_FULL_49_13]OGP40780.1 MAG: hypothetical protein A2324_03715 [Candidatus Raymondbacteria 
MGVWKNKKLRICLVDDDQDALEISGKMLKAKGAAEVICLSSTENALKVLPHANVTAIISDIEMEGMSGRDLFATVRKNKALNAVRFIVISGAMPPQSWVKETDGFFEKPLDHEKLHAQLVKYRTEDDDSEEKRLYRRHNATSDVVVSSNDKAVQDIRNVSLSGLCFESSVEYQHGDTLQFEAHAWDSEKASSVSGVIVWKQQENGHFVYGVHFNAPLLPSE